MRWSFEAVGRDLGIRALLLEGGNPLGPRLVASYGDAGFRATGTYWAFLGITVVVCLLGALLVLARTADRSSR